MEGVEGGRLMEQAEELSAREDGAVGEHGGATARALEQSMEQREETDTGSGGHPDATGAGGNVAPWHLALTEGVEVEGQGSDLTVSGRWRESAWRREIARL